MKTNKKRNTMAAIGLAAVVAVAGTFAYWNQTSSVTNPFDTSRYGSTITEDFVPSDGHEWQPGVEINKDVVVDNTGDTEVIVRVRLDETWSYKGEATPYKDSNADGFTPYSTTQDNAEDGLTAADGSVVIKTFSTSANWIDGGDGWYYYKENLPGQSSTDLWLDSVELLGDADMGKMEVLYYVTASDDADRANWIWYPYSGSMPAYIDADGNPCEKDDAGAQAVLHNMADTVYAAENGLPLLGYSNSDYKLKVTMQTVQPTQEALDAIFGSGTSFAAPTGTTWSLK